MKVLLFLADYAQADPGTGKVHALGIGWHQTVTPTPPGAVVALIDVDWHETNVRFDFRLELLDSDGASVLVPGPAGLNPIIIEGVLEAGRPPGTTEGTPISMPLTVNLSAGLPLPLGRYEWRLSIGDDFTESVFFAVIGQVPVGPPR